MYACFSCNLPPALLAEWPGSFTCYWDNTAIIRGWNGYRNKSQHRKSTLEKKILPPFQQGFEPATFQSRVRRSNHWAIPAPYFHTEITMDLYRSMTTDKRTGSSEQLCGWKGPNVLLNTIETCLGINTRICTPFNPPVHSAYRKLFSFFKNPNTPTVQSQNSLCFQSRLEFRCTFTTRMTPALRWAAMRAILLWWTKSQDSLHKPQPFWREKRVEAELNWAPSA